MHKNIYDADIFNKWKDDVRDDGDRAMRHFFIDFDRGEKATLTWGTIMNNLLNS